MVFLSYKKVMSKVIEEFEKMMNNMKKPKVQEKNNNTLKINSIKKTLQPTEEENTLFFAIKKENNKFVDGIKAASKTVNGVLEEAKQMKKNTEEWSKRKAQNYLIKKVEKNLENKDKLLEKDFKNWRETSNLGKKEDYLKSAAGKILEVVPVIRYKSAYFGLYIAPNDIRDFYLGKGGDTLYLEKFPKEYKKIMNLGEVHRGAFSGLEKLGKVIENEVKKINLKEGNVYKSNYKEINESIKLEDKGALEWGTSTLKIKDISYTVYKKNGEYKVNVNYTPYLTDSFKDVPDLFNIDKGEREFSGGKPFKMQAKGETLKVEFSVKKLEDITKKLKGTYLDKIIKNLKNKDNMQSVR